MRLQSDQRRKTIQRVLRPKQPHSRQQGLLTVTIMIWHSHMSILFCGLTVASFDSWRQGARQHKGRLQAPQECPGVIRRQAARSELYANVVSQLVQRSGNDEEDPSNLSGGKQSSTRPSTQKLSRAERKAQERLRNEENASADAARSRRRKHNFAERQAVLSPKHSAGEGRYDLHSNAVRTLNHSSTPDDVMRAIKRAQNLHDAHDILAIERFLLEQTDENFAYGFRGSLLSRLAVAALHMGRHTIARKAIEERRQKHRDSMLPMESAAIIRGLLRVHNVTDALSLLEDELPVPLLDQATDPSFNELELPGHTRALLQYRALALASIASRHFYEGEVSQAVLACRKLQDMGSVIRLAGMTAGELNIPWERLIKGATECEAGRRLGQVDKLTHDDHIVIPCNIVYAVLNAMSAFPSEGTDRIYELLSNALVRRVVFVTGAVSMDKCPPPDRGEAAFIGRSNVGKSSLVNMITNRKSLAFTSKTPGKTQEFNFFAVNDKVDREREIKYGDTVNGEMDGDSFYIVDLPGFGYAKVPEQKRKQWMAFMRQYIAERESLRVLFHLIDARHGPTDEDAAIMKQTGEILPSSVQYVIVLTKADKNVKGASSATAAGKVSDDVVQRVRDCMEVNGVRHAPLLLSSAKSKLGRDELWKYLRRAAEK